MIVASKVVATGSSRANGLSSSCGAGVAADLKAIGGSAPAQLDTRLRLATPGATRSDRHWFRQPVGQPIIDDSQIFHSRQVDIGLDAGGFTIERGDNADR